MKSINLSETIHHTLKSKKILPFFLWLICFLLFLKKSDVEWHQARNYIVLFNRYSLDYILFIITLTLLSSAISLKKLTPLQKGWKQYTFNITEYVLIISYTLTGTLSLAENYLQHHPMKLLHINAPISPSQLIILSLGENISDPELGYRPRPKTQNSKMRGPFALQNLYDTTETKFITPPAVDYQTDANGFRNPPGVKKAQLLSIGDSVTHGAFVQRDEIWSVILANRLGYSEANLAMSGYSPQQEVITLERYGFQLQPELVLCQIFYGNDLGDAFNFEQWKRSEKNYLEFINESFGPMPDLFLCGEYLKGLLQKPEITDKQDKFKPIVCDLHGQKVKMGFYPNPTFWFMREDEIKNHPGFNALIQAMEKGKQLCEQRNIQFLVCLVPDKLMVYYDFIADEENQMRLLKQQNPQWLKKAVPLNQNHHEELRRFLDHRKNVITAALEEKHIEFIDMTESFRNHVQQAGEIVYYPFDTHWNPKGHQLAAGIVYQYLEK